MRNKEKNISNENKMFQKVTVTFLTFFIFLVFSCDFTFKPKTKEEETFTWDTAKPLKDIYTGSFLMGNIVSPNDLTNVRFNILKRHYNTVTAENHMKPSEIAPSSKPASDDWTSAYRWYDKEKEKEVRADGIVKAVNDAGLKMHGHTLVWHQQTPQWLNADQATALANLKKYVTDVTKHFKGKVISWDVVNEAMKDGLSISDAVDWKKCLRPGGWNTIGPEYIEEAFLAARKADPDAILFYNDYNLNSNTGNGKPLAVFNMVQDINNRYRDVLGGLLIDGIGMQSHHHLNTTPESVEASIVLFSSLGVDITISELDIMAAKATINNGQPNGLTNPWDDNAAQLQAEKYAAMFRIFKKHEDKISRVTFWGLDDRSSWRASSYPTLLDKDYNLKPAFYAVANPDKF